MELCSMQKGGTMAIKRVGVLTGGGDVPGLNSAIKAIVDAGMEKDFEIIGLRRGW
jgi:6-phosphofructokinase